MTEMKKKVLVVDESSTMRQFYQIILNRIEKVDVTAVRGSEEALMAMDREPAAPFDLVITDSLEGMDLLAKLRKDSNPDLPVILVSETDCPEEEVSALAAGASKILQKPFDGGILVKTIQPYIN